MTQRETFPNTDERRVIREFMMGREVPVWSNSRLSIKRRDDVLNLVMFAPGVAIAHIANGSLEAEPSIAPGAAEHSAFQVYQTKVLVFIFEELGDQRAYQPRSTWFPKAGANVVCGPMTLRAYRANRMNAAQTTTVVKETTK